MRANLQPTKRSRFRWWLVPIYIVRWLFRFSWVVWRGMRRVYRQLPPTLRRRISRGVLLLLLLAVLAPFVVKVVTRDIPRWYYRWLHPGDIAPLFTAEVQHWSADVVRWAEPHGLDPNLLATVMQIESCGHPTVISPAGARGLFQVMPFHFEANEDMIDPETNARRGANFLVECSGYAGGDIGKTFACYNGGPGTIRRDFSQWPHETQRYYYWALGIYEDATRGAFRSERLDEWLNAGGVNLCRRASLELMWR